MDDIIEDEPYIDDLHSNNCSPVREEQEYEDLCPQRPSNLVGSKRIYGTFNGRAEMVLKQNIYEAADPIPMERSEIDRNLHGRVGTKYMHAIRQGGNEVGQ